MKAHLLIAAIEVLGEAVDVLKDKNRTLAREAYIVRSNLLHALRAECPDIKIEVSDEQI
jgi:hypothetical protein